MSIRYIERAMWAKGLGKTNKAVLVAIADAVSDNGIGWLLISSIIKKTDLSERAIQSALAEMCDTRDGTVLPILERRERAKRSSIFRIHLDRIPQHEHGHSDKEMTAEEMWGAGDAPLKPMGAAGAPHPRSGRTPPPQGLHPEPSLEPSIEPIPPLPSEVTTPNDLFDADSGSSKDLVIADPPIADYVAEQWKLLCVDYPRTQGVRIWNPSRKNGVATRAREVVAASGGTVSAQRVWDAVFSAIRADPWLRGEGTPGKNHAQAFSLYIDYVLQPRRFAQILERAPINELDNGTTSDSTGRRFGPGEQAIHDAIRLLQSRR